MRKSHLLFAPLVTCLILGASSKLFAQLGSSPTNSHKHECQADPPTDALRVANDPSLEFEKLLDQWIAKSSNIYPLCLRYSRSEYSRIWYTEHVVKGTCFIDSPHRWMVQERSVELAKGSQSQRKDPQCKPYKLTTGNPWRLLCTGDALLSIDDDKKTCMKQAIEEEYRNIGIVPTQYPLRLLENPEEIRQRFKLSVTKDNATSVTILGIRKTVNQNEQDGTSWSFWSFSSPDLVWKIAVTLDKSTCLPKQIHTLDDSRVENVYTFDSIEFNSTNGRIGEWYPNDGIDWLEVQGYECFDFNAPVKVNCAGREREIAPNNQK